MGAGFQRIEAVARRKIHEKTPVPMCLAQVFSCKFCEISNDNLFTTLV